MSIDFEADAEAFRKAILGTSAPPKPALPLPVKPTIRSEFVKTKYGLAGPYFYAYWREGKKVKKKYLGKQLPDNLRFLYRTKNVKPDDSIESALSALFDEGTLNPRSANDSK